MAIREDLVASAAKFLQDPSVASSPVENRIAFLQSRNLTQEEVNAALARAASESGTPPSYPSPPASSAFGQPQPYYGQYPPQYPPNAWQQVPPEPRRDWRDWFIMATVVSGVGYGLYSLGKRYIYPLVAPPTPERLQQDKQSIDDQFERAFALVEQLAKDTEALKAAEQERTERLDTALVELETVMNELKSASRRRDDEAQRIRDDVQTLKDSIPRAMDNQKEAAESRLREINTELKSLKTLISQRMSPTTASTSVGNYLRPSASNAAPSSPGQTPSAGEGADANGSSTEEQSKAPSPQDYLSGLNRSSPLSGSMQPSKASIPAWQLAMATKNAGASSSSTNGTTGAAAETGSGSQENGGES